LLGLPDFLNPVGIASKRDNLFLFFSASDVTIQRSEEKGRLQLWRHLERPGGNLKKTHFFVTDDKV
jgi:hypothetical protein